MSRLTWGAPTERFFETGVDRGVLYVGVAAGVPWNGLVSVSEAPTGGEAKPAYIDGYKFRNVASSEEFEATIEAFAAPKEFAPCDGSVSIQNGLIATQQPRRSFSLSYRTKVGNAVEGADHAYKIHLVYNALAAPAQRNNATLSDSQGLPTLSWSLTTLPPSLTGMKPTAHFIIDSRSVPKMLLAAIEDILYGSASAAPRMPLVSELVTLFQSEGPVTRRNYYMTPSLRATSGTTEVRRNLHVNPFVLGTGAAVEVRRNKCLDPKIVFASGWVGITAGTGAITAASGYTHNVTAVAGETWTVSADFTAPAGSALTGILSVGSTAGGLFGVLARGTTNLNVPAGTTVRYSNTFVLPSGADGLRLLLSNINITNGTAFIANMLIEKTAFNLPFFYGATPNALGLTYTWAGSVNASESIATGTPALGFTTSAGTTQYQSDIGGKKWTQTHYGAYLYAQATGVVGKYYAAKLRVAGPPGTIFVINSTDNVVGNWLSSAGNITMPAEGEIELSFPSGPANAGSSGGGLMVGPSGTTARLLRITDILIEEVPGTGLYIRTGPAFSGATPAADGLTYTWAGTVNNSASIATGNVAIGTSRYGNAADIAFWQGVDGLDKTQRIIVKKPTVLWGMLTQPTHTYGLAQGVWAANDLFIASAWVKGTAGVAIWVEAGATGVAFNPKVQHVLSGDWDRVYIASAVPAGVLTSAPYMLLRAVAASELDMTVKKIMIEDGNTLLDHFDGSTPDENAYFYSWDGAADLTASKVNTWH